MSDGEKRDCRETNPARRDMSPMPCSLPIIRSDWQEMYEAACLRNQVPRRRSQHAGKGRMVGMPIMSSNRPR